MGFEGQAKASMPYRSLRGWAVVAVVVLIAGCSDGAPTPVPAPEATPPSPAATAAELSPSPSPRATDEPPPPTGLDLTASDANPMAEVITDHLNVRLGPRQDAAVIGQVNTGDRFDIGGRSVEGDWVMIPGTGWVFRNPEWIRLNVSLTDIDVSAPFDFFDPNLLHGPDVRTGVPSIDAVIDAVVGGDREAMFELLVVSEVACLAQPEHGDGSVACPEGVAEGTVLAAVNLGFGCDVSLLLLRDATPSSLDLWFAHGREEAGSLRLYAAGRLPDSEDYVVVFALDDGFGSRATVSAESGVLSVGLGCGPTAPPDMFLFHYGPENEGRLVLPPVTAVPLSPPPR